MALTLGNSLIRLAENLQWKVVETHAKVILHTQDCNQYGYFFDDEPSIPIKYPCMLGYKYWTNSMTTNYLNERAHDCKFYMPSTDYDVEYFWESGQVEQADQLIHVEGDWQMPEIYQAMKKNIELHWNYVRHLAKNVVNHNHECISFKIQNGKYGCLKNFIRWDEKIIMDYYEPKSECDF